MVGQRIWRSFDVQGLDGMVDGRVGRFWASQGPMGEMMGFEAAPDCFDAVAFGRLCGRPRDASPMGAGGERGPGRLAGMDRSFVEHDDHGALALAGFGADTRRSAPRPIRALERVALNLIQIECNPRQAS
ncbi:MAG: hypothetical protein WCS20_14060, partial [Alphaproteobacteria bacterium]